MFTEYFEGISDPRQPWKIKHQLIEVIIIVLIAVTAECERWYQIAAYCKKKEAFFKEKLGMELVNGIPSHDTMERVFKLLKPEEFELRFAKWTRAVTKLNKGDSVNIDGKTLCGSRDGEKEAIEMVSAWANKQNLVLGQLKVEDGSNEITAVPELLEILDVEGCVITSDSLNCQKETTAKITEKGADYVLGLKGNHEKLHKGVSEYFMENPKSANCPNIYTKNTGHGRIEERHYWLETDISFLENVPEIELWSNLNAVGMVKSVTIRKGKPCFEVRYFITSLTDAEHFAKSVREHWGIENSLHWCLDVAFGEDNSRIRADNSAENMAVIRHISLNLLKADNSNGSIKSKRHRCAYDDDFLLHILSNLA